MENHVCKEEYEDILWRLIKENWKAVFYDVEGQFNLAVSTSIASGVVLGEYATGIAGALRTWTGAAFGAISGFISFALSDRTPADAVSATVDTIVGTVLGELLTSLRAAYTAATAAVESAGAALAAAQTAATNTANALLGAQSAAAEATAARVAAQALAQQAAAVAVTAEEYAAAQALTAAATRAAVFETTKIALVGAAERSALAAAAEVTAATAARVAAVGALEAASGIAAFVAANIPTIAAVLAGVFIGAIAGLFAKSAIEAQTEYDAQENELKTLDLRAPEHGITNGVTLESLTTYQHALNADGTFDEDLRNGIRVAIQGWKDGAASDEGCIEQIILTGYSDTLDTRAIDLSQYDDWHFADNRFVIDMGGGVDTVKYQPRSAPLGGSNGIFYYDGETHSAGGGFGAGQNILGITSTNLMLGLLRTESYLPDDDLIVIGQENIILTNENDRFVFTGQPYRIGDKSNTIHSGYGKISGGGGGDIIVFNGAKAGPGGLTLEIDGGTGNDWLYVMGGTGAVVYGGTGRDYIVNRSKGGVIYGDTVDGVGAGDSKANADKIEMSMGVTLMDAGIWDQVVFHGIRLTGGVYGGRPAGKNTVYDDKLMSGIAYKQVGSDVWVYNRYADIGNLNGGGASGGANKDNVFVIKNLNIAAASSGWGLDQLGISNETKLGLSFKTRNPWTEDVLKLMSYSSLVPIVGGLAAALGALGTLVIMLDELLNRVTAVALAAKSLRWAAGTDPLVIDLDGDGIETTGLGDSRTYFDVDGDMFRERTGWLKGDDGFLVLDGNANGRIDDISEMFGNRFQGGYDELRGYDTNGDGKISVADLIWSELQVWQDTNQDGETDTGELKSLTALGIFEISLSSTALNATTPQGAQLLSYGSVIAANDNSDAWEMAA